MEKIKTETPLGPGDHLGVLKINFLRRRLESLGLYISKNETLDGVQDVCTKLNHLPGISFSICSCTFPACIQFSYGHQQTLFLQAGLYCHQLNIYGQKMLKFLKEFNQIFVLVLRIFHSPSRIKSIANNEGDIVVVLHCGFFCKFLVVCLVSLQIP